MTTFPSVIRRDDRIGRVQLELLQAENLFFDGVARDEAIDVDDFLLADPVRSVHCLKEQRHSFARVSSVISHSRGGAICNSSLRLIRSQT